MFFFGIILLVFNVLIILKFYNIKIKLYYSFFNKKSIKIEKDLTIHR